MLTDTPRTFVGSTTLRLRGMTSGPSRIAVIEEVSRVPGVRGVAVDPAAGTVTVTVDQLVDRTDVAAAVHRTGCALLH